MINRNLINKARGRGAVGSIVLILEYLKKRGVGLYK